MDKLNELMQAASAELYKNASAQGAGAEAGTPPPDAEEPKSEDKPDDGTVIDAEVVDEKKS